MKTEVTLPEKLKDLRAEKKLKLADVSEAVGIPVSTLQRIEGQEDMRVGYQDVAALAKFYGVSCDYLFGMTENRQYRNVEIDKLRLSDEAIAVLEKGRMNHRLLSELLAHKDFPALMRALEIYVDRKVLPQMNTMNDMYKFAEQTIRDNFAIEDDDEVMALLQEAVVDEDDYLRQKITERFNDVARGLFAAHKKDALDNEGQNEVLEEMKGLVHYYLDEKERDAERAKVNVFAKQIGLDIDELKDEEVMLLMKVLDKSQLVKDVQLNRQQARQQAHHHRKGKGKRKK